MNLTWYARRLSRMTPGEALGRARDETVKLCWRARQGEPPEPDGPVTFVGRLPDGALERIPRPARARLVASAEDALGGHWPVFDRTADLGERPDWFADPRSGRRAPAEGYAFGIPHRDEGAVGNVKYVWELSRHHHLTVLAAAWRLTGEERFARRVAAHLRWWWAENPFLTGIHWTSGIEVGMRLLAWAWIRRLLDGWEEAPALFEDDPEFGRQLAAHEEYLETLPSRGSSANNHLLAEAVGLFVGTSAFPSGLRSAERRLAAAETLRREIPRQTFPDGVNRELATGYHGFVLELGLAAALEGEVGGVSLGVPVWTVLRAMTDALAGLLDAAGRPPRQGDGDEAHGLLVDAPGYDRWAALLHTGEALFGALPWWPERRAEDARTAVWTALATPPVLPGGRPERAPTLWPDAGLALLVADRRTPDEIWCRCDHGPLGYLATAAHGHADHLAIELRVGGVEVVVDPGTYCYHGERQWRDHFRGTRSHATLELARVHQARPGGPFMWLDRPVAWLVEVVGLDAGPRAHWTAEHDGYRRLSPSAVHRRIVTLDREERVVRIVDRLSCDGAHPCRLTLPLGASISAALEGDRARLAWEGPAGARMAEVTLPALLHWSLAVGQEDPPDGWVAPNFGRRVPAPCLVGCGVVAGGETLETRIVLKETRPTRPSRTSVQAFERGGD